MKLDDVFRVVVMVAASVVVCWYYQPKPPAIEQQPAARQSQAVVSNGSSYNPLKESLGGFTGQNIKPPPIADGDNIFDWYWNHQAHLNVGSNGSDPIIVGVLDDFAFPLWNGVMQFGFIRELLVLCTWVLISLRLGLFRARRLNHSQG